MTEIIKGENGETYSSKDVKDCVEFWRREGFSDTSIGYVLIRERPRPDKKIPRENKARLKNYDPT